MANLKTSYKENQAFVGDRPSNFLRRELIGAAGIATNPLIDRGSATTLQDLIRGTAILSDNFKDKSGQFQLNPNLKNVLLDIPSLLVYPQELGTNKRYKHFMMLNIYQGTSDEVRLETRKTNLLFSAAQAKGGVGFNIFSGNEGDKATLINILTSEGYSIEQATDFARRMSLGTGYTGSDGLTTDARLGALDQALTGVYSNLFNIKTEEEGQGVISAGLDTLTQFSADAINSFKQFFYDMVQQSYRDNLDPNNRVDRNIQENLRGVSGRRVYRDRKEDSILLANRRFNNANVKSKDTICLYMPQKIAFNDQLVYSEEEMGPLKTLTDALTGKRGGVSALIEKGLARGLADQIGQLPGVNLAGDLNLAAARAAGTRSVPNPRREMMFRDVGIRTHSFSFDFAPDNDKEAQTVLDIIRMLRYHAYPGLQDGGGHFFTFPAEFDITFYTITEEGMVLVNDNLPKMPRLGLQSISVDYSSAGDYKTFVDAKPAFIRVDLQFQEMEQLTNEHIIHGY
jgi:hypothetical protein